MIDRDYWLYLHFREGRSSEITCPTCGTGKINILGKFESHQTKNTIELQRQEYCDFMKLNDKFSGLLKCDNEYCNDVVAVCGNAFPEPECDIDEGNRQKYYKCFQPEFFSPSLKIFPLKNEYPARVKEILEKSFSLFLVDCDSCGNKIRISIEALLDELGIEKENPKNDKTYNLHQRIEKYQKINANLGELMLSIKWIGNYGSHDDSISKSDLLDAYEMINYILDDIYDNHAKKISELAKTINENKRPASKIIKPNNY